MLKSMINYKHSAKHYYNNFFFYRSRLQVSDDKIISFKKPSIFIGLNKTYTVLPTYEYRGLIWTHGTQTRKYKLIIAKQR